jgi:hypothetical protein
MRESSREWAWFLVISAIAGVLVLGPARTAVANAGCGDPEPYANFHRGRGILEPPINARGAKADLTIRGTQICYGADSWSYSFVMLHGEDSDQWGWAQIGFYRKNFGQQGSRWRWQYQQNLWQCDCPVAADYGTPVIATTYEVKVSRYPSDGKIHMLVDNQPGACNAGGYCAITPFDPLLLWPEVNASWESETYHPETDIQGTNSYRTDFDVTQVKDHNDDWYYGDWNQSIADCPGFYKLHVSYSNRHFQSWTDPVDRATGCW